MANYFPPLNDSDVFLIDNFISDNEYLDLDERYLKKTGDNATGNYYWSGTIIIMELTTILRNQDILMKIVMYCYI